MIRIIYIIFGHVKEKVSLNLGGGLSQCYIHSPIMSSQEKLLFRICMLGFLIMIDPWLIPLTGSFMKKTIEFWWDLLEGIKRNSEDWELDEGKESGIKLKYDCVKSFMITDAFQKFSTKYGLDSEIVASFCESFATHVDLPKEKWFKYHPPIKEEIKEPVTTKDETIIYNVNLVVPTSYIEKPPFP